MDDLQIVELFWQRSEKAITESQQKYYGYCSTIAYNILHSPEDTEECVNDTWIKAWNTIPPSRPHRLSVFLGKIIRNIALDRYRKNKTLKRGKGQAAICLDELAECIADGKNFADDLVVKDTLNYFLQSLNSKKRHIFMLRYWYLFSIKDIAKYCSMSEGAVKMSLQRTRIVLKEFLEKEGIYL